MNGVEDGWVNGGWVDGSMHERADGWSRKLRRWISDGYVWG